MLSLEKDKHWKLESNHISFFVPFNFVKDKLLRVWNGLGISENFLNPRLLFEGKPSLKIDPFCYKSPDFVVDLILVFAIQLVFDFE